MTMDALRCENLNVGYAGKTVLEDVCLAIPSGSLTVLIGANGSGKSTLLRTLAGIQSPLSGEIYIEDKPLSRYKPKELSSRRAIVDTNRQGGGALTVAEAVSIGRNASVSLFGNISSECKASINKAMDIVGVKHLADRYMATLSDGERQKVMIARALAQDSPVIFLDEPTAFLDVAARIEVMELLYKLRETGKTIILSTHDIAPAVSRADTIIVVDRLSKRIITGSRDELIANGTLDIAFEGTGVRFDSSILDYR